jgi:protein SCO1/2
MTTRTEHVLTEESELDDAPVAQGSSRLAKLIGGAFLAIAVVVCAVLLYRSQETPYTYHGGFYSPPSAAPPLNLTDMNGNPFTLNQLEGKVALIYFGYTTCPDICPTTLVDFQAVKDDLGEDADRVEFLLVTIDPERDTEAKLKEYLAFFDPDFIGLRGDAEQTKAFTRDYGIVVKRVDYPDSATGYLLDHSAQSFAIDPAGRLALTFPYGMDPALIAEDIRHLLNT